MYPMAEQRKPPETAFNTVVPGGVSAMPWINLPFGIAEKPASGDGRV
jgi:hypothetical protein